MIFLLVKSLGWGSFYVSVLYLMIMCMGILYAIIINSSIISFHLFILLSVVSIYVSTYCFFNDASIYWAGEHCSSLDPWFCLSVGLFIIFLQGVWEFIGRYAALCTLWVLCQLLVWWIYLFNFYWRFFFSFSKALLSSFIYYCVEFCYSLNLFIDLSNFSDIGKFNVFLLIVIF